MKKFAIIALFSFLGGITGSLIFSSGISWAAKEQLFGTTNFISPQGQRVGEIGAHSTGEGTFFLFNGNNLETTVQMGAYGSGAERGQSLLGLHDRNGRLRHLTRMHGSTDAPTVIFKDNAGRDRIVFGIDPSTQEPYFRYTDKNNTVKRLF